jgi:uncharacterized protein (TIGR02117 family)
MRLLRGLVLLLGVVLALPAVYLLAALLLGLVPVNADFKPSSVGVAVFVRTNGVHAELVLPAHASSIDWTQDHPPTHMRGLAQPLDWVAFGWGDRDFFATTPTWADLRPRTALVALSGVGEGAMHVEYIASPHAYAGRELRLSAEQYARLADFVRDSFRRDAAGKPQRLELPGYFATDAFYAAVPNYVFWFTCNDWVRRGLTVAGVRAPRWSPFDAAIFHQLDRIQSTAR